MHRRLPKIHGSMDKLMGIVDGLCGEGVGPGREACENAHCRDGEERRP